MLSQRNAGYSLLEMVLAIGLLGIVMTSVIGVYSSTSRSHTTQMAVAGVQETVRAGTLFMIRDLRMAGLDPQQSGNFGFEEATAQKVRFTADRGNMDGEVDNADQERLTYSFEDSQVKQIRYEGTGSAITYPMVDNVTQCRFTYLDTDGNDLGDPVGPDDLARIRSVRVTLTVTEPAGRDRAVTRTLTHHVVCRNMGFRDSLL